MAGDGYGLAWRLGGFHWRGRRGLAGQELLRAVYAAVGTAAARAVLERFHRWADGVGVAELVRLARMVKAWEAELLAWHATDGCSNGPIEAMNLLL